LERNSDSEKNITGRRIKEKDLIKKLGSVNSNHNAILQKFVDNDLITVYKANGMNFIFANMIDKNTEECNEIQNQRDAEKIRNEKTGEKEMKNEFTKEEYNRYVIAIDDLNNNIKISSMQYIKESDLIREIGSKNINNHDAIILHLRQDGLIGFIENESETHEKENLILARQRLINIARKLRNEKTREKEMPIQITNEEYQRYILLIDDLKKAGRCSGENNNILNISVLSEKLDTGESINNAILEKLELNRLINLTTNADGSFSYEKLIWINEALIKKAQDLRDPETVLKPGIGNHNIDIVKCFSKYISRTIAFHYPDRFISGEYEHEDETGYFEFKNIIFYDFDLTDVTVIIDDDDEPVIKGKLPKGIGAIFTKRALIYSIAQIASETRHHVKG